MCSEVVLISELERRAAFACVRIVGRSAYDLCVCLSVCSSLALSLCFRFCLCLWVPFSLFFYISISLLPSLTLSRSRAYMLVRVTSFSPLLERMTLEDGGACVEVETQLLTDVAVTLQDTWQVFGEVQPRPPRSEMCEEKSGKRSSKAVALYMLSLLTVLKAQICSDCASKHGDAAQRL